MRLADGAIFNDPLDIVLFVEILDQALLLFEDGAQAITASFLTGLLTLCAQHLRYIEGRAPAEAKRALASTAAHLQTKAADPCFAGLQNELNQVRILSLAA